MISKVSIVNCEDYDSNKVYDSVKKSINDIGFKFKPASKVLIKPNVLSQHKPEEHITTHPTVIDAVCKILLENKCSITIGDSSGWYREGGTKKAFEVSGIADIARKHNAKLITFEESGSKKINDPDAVILKEFNIAKPVFDAELVVNVPKLKTHTLTQYTGAVKNLLGTLPGGLKQRCHVVAPKANEFGNLLLDIYKHVKPELNILDGIVGIEGNGPGTGGLKKKTGIIMASENAIALDIVAQRIIGMEPMGIATTRNAIKRKMFSDINDIEIIGTEIKVPYKKPIAITGLFPGFMSAFALSNAIITPKVNKRNCRKCRKCVVICPVGAMEMLAYPKINKKKCIHCYCCHEMCPYNALEMKGSFVFEILRKIKDLIIRPKD